jgi:outer membrane biosynthesis protein TonB
VSETPTPASEPPLRVAVLRNLGAAVALVVLVAAVFGAIGMAGGQDETPSPVAADGPAPDDEATEPEATEPEEAEPEEAEPEEAEPDEAEPEPEPEAELEAEEPEEADEPEEVEPEPEPEPEPEEPAEVEESEPEPEPEPEEAEPDPAPAIAPGDVSIQVLDGYKADGGAAARAVAATLRDRGYRIIAENQALSYDRTAVLYTAGHEAAGRQVAAEIGAAELRQQPGNLSTSVDVHVVVGADRG